MISFCQNDITIMRLPENGRSIETAM
jgi:hypothetical protein